MFTTWMGIDPGLHGALAVQYSNRPARAVIMPLTDKKIDPQKISLAIDLLLDYDPTFGYRPTLVYIEDVHAMPNQGVTSMFNFGFGVGVLHGILAAKGFTIHRVHPVRWKNRVLKNSTKDKTVAIDYCLKNFPTAMPFAHDGIADALCISEYARHFHSENIDSKSRAAPKRKRAARSTSRA